MSSLTGIRISKICVRRSTTVQSDRYHQSKQSDRCSLSEGSTAADCRPRKRTPADHFSDEIYDRLVMDGKEHVSIASLAPDLFCVTFSGLSKSHMIAGFRIGWMILSGNKNIARDYIEGIKMLSNMRLCSNVPAQSIVQTALGGHPSVNDYIVRVDVFTSSVNMFTRL